jgi:hypothetical protein
VRRAGSLRGARAPIAASLGISAVFSAVAVGRTASGGLLVTLFDDAMISMTYARNLAEGEGLVWNAGEPAVEGYSNFLWTVLMAPAQMLGLDDRFAGAPILLLGALVLAVTVFLVHRLTNELLPGRERVATRAAWIVALLYPLSFWTLRGMEVGLVAALTCGAVLVALRMDLDRRGGLLWVLGLLAAALVLTRDDAAIPSVLVLAYATWRGLHRRDLRLLVPSALFVAAVAGHEAFRWVVYGELLPNTYYLKLSGVPLGTRVDRGVETLLSLDHLPLLSIVLVAMIGARHVCRRRAALPLTVFGAGVAYSVAVGGDAWEWMPYPNRYVTAVLPLTVPFVAAAMDRAMQPALGARVASAIVAIALAFPVAMTGVEGIHHLDRDAAWARQGLAIRASTDPGTWVAMGAAGNVGFFARRPAIDLLGKSDPIVARGPQIFEFNPGHSKVDLDHSIGRLRPGLVLHVPHATSRSEDMRRWGYSLEGWVWYLPDAVTTRAAAVIDQQGRRKAVDR